MIFIWRMARGLRFPLRILGLGRSASQVEVADAKE
jgi:hypothetical protein